MIKIAGNSITSYDMLGYYPVGSIEMIIANKMFESSLIYDYTTILQYKFELNLRVNIITSAKNLYNSKLSFSTFRKSRCNTDFWTRTDEGGFLLKDGVDPRSAIRNIFNEGYKYATECATAIIIIYYGAIADMITETQFNNMFRSIYLMNWKRLDRNLGVRTYNNTVDELPGDCCYFKNPDVDPLTPEWQGENAITLGDGTYYGHGIGIKTADGIIHTLNNHRKSEATISAYKMNTVTRPGFKHLFERLNLSYQYFRFQGDYTSSYNQYAL